MHRRGFTLIEVVIVVMIATILTSITLNAFSGVQKRMAVRQARNAFMSLHALARAQAIEHGTQTRLLMSTDGDSIWVTRDGSTVEKIRFQDELMVDLAGTASSYRLCMNARGYGDESCTSFSSAVTLRFIARNGGDTTSVQMLPLGQLIY